MLDFKKLYILQAITSASNNLRLSSEKIEVVTLLREHLSNVPDLESEINRMKTITEFSKFAVRLSELYIYISSNLIDFNRISEQFKEHSHNLVRELSNLLDVVTPVSFKKIVNSKNSEIQVELKDNNIKAELSFGGSLKNEEDVEKNEIVQENVPEEEIVLEPEFNYDNFVQSVLEPIKEFDEFLQALALGKRDNEKLEYYYDIVLRNINLSQQAGLEIVTKMHKIISHALKAIREGDFATSFDNIDALRSCLIVIVAVVRQKDVDISVFLDKAETLNYLLEENER